MTPPTEPVTELLHAARQGDEAALGRLFDRLYQELRVLARQVRGGRAGQTLNTTALVHEAYLRLAPSDLDLQDRRHFLRVAARAMRHVLVDAARRQSAQKRGGDAVAVTYEEERHAGSVHADDVLALHDALDALARLDARQAEVVELRVFGGLTVDETASALGLSAPTVYRDWRAARAWLTRELAS